MSRAATGSSRSSGSSTSVSLLRRVQANEPGAWERLVDLYGPLVFHWCRQCQLNHEDASDVMQEVFTAVCTRLDTFIPDSPGSTFRGWLWTITRNKIRDLQRRRRHRPAVMGGSAADLQLGNIGEPLSDEASAPTDPGEEQKLFHRALDLVRAEFEDRTWTAFWRAVVDEQDTATIAADLGMTANAVRQAKSRVLRRLRQELGDLL
jgi:RNA polymerase sigma-70 factor (ECF subfamily)